MTTGGKKQEMKKGQPRRSTSSSCSSLNYVLRRSAVLTNDQFARERIVAHGLTLNTHFNSILGPEKVFLNDNTFSWYFFPAFSETIMLLRLGGKTLSCFTVWQRKRLWKAKHNECVWVCMYACVKKSKLYWVVHYLRVFLGSFSDADKTKELWESRTFR